MLIQPPLLVAIYNKLKAFFTKWYVPSLLDNVRFSKEGYFNNYTVNIAYRANDPNVGMSLDKDLKRFKLFASDVGLFITLAFKDKKYTENIIYSKLLSNYVLLK